MISTVAQERAENRPTYLCKDVKVVERGRLLVCPKRVAVGVLGNVLTPCVLVEQFWGQSTMRGYEFEQSEANIDKNGGSRL